MTKKQQRKIKLRKSAIAYKSRGYVKVGRTWFRFGSSAYDAAVKSLRKR